MKFWLQKLLESIGAANQARFGEERLDCCQLNKPDEGTETGQEEE